MQFQGIQHHFDLKNMEKLVEQGHQKWDQFVAEQFMPFRESVIGLFIDIGASKGASSEEEVVVISQHKEDKHEDLIQSSMNEKMGDNEPDHKIVTEPPMTQQTVFTVAVQDTVKEEKAGENEPVPEPTKKPEQ